MNEEEIKLLMEKISKVEEFCQKLGLSFERKEDGRFAPKKESYKVWSDEELEILKGLVHAKSKKRMTWRMIAQEFNRIAQADRRDASIYQKAKEIMRVESRNISLRRK